VKKRRGAKRVSTLSWRTSHCGLVGICASRRLPADCRDLCGREPFFTALSRASVFHPTDLPLGALVGVAALTDCWLTEELPPRTLTRSRPPGQGCLRSQKGRRHGPDIASGPAALL
jgi:hypothetical protein